METDNDTLMVPLVDCPWCGEKDVPQSYEGTWSKEGSLDVVIWVCSNCGKLPSLFHSVVIKRWVTAAELEAQGWKLQPKGGTRWKRE